MVKTRTKFIIGGVISIIIVILFCFGISQIEKPFDDFCKEKGYNKMTDSTSYVPVNGYDLQVECDKKAIFFVNNIPRCVGLNKWGQCKRYIMRVSD